MDIAKYEDDGLVMLEKIKWFYNDYIKDDSYVYNSVGKYIIILRKGTDEQKGVIVNKKNAKYEGKCLKVVKIFCKYNVYEQIISLTDDIRKLFFECGQFVIYNGLYHWLYYKSIDVAFYHDLRGCLMNYSFEMTFKIYDNGYKYFNGQVKLYHENGRLSCLQIYKNGKLNGIAKMWHENGELASVVEYEKGEMSGKYLRYDYDGNIVTNMNFGKTK